jgi:hypothetical protein
MATDRLELRDDNNPAARHCNNSWLDAYDSVVKRWSMDVEAKRSRLQPDYFASGEYRISAIEIEDGRGTVTKLHQFGEPKPDDAPTILRCGEPFRLRVHYECLLAEIPDASCGVASAFTLVKTMEHIMYFNTNYPHSDDELAGYDSAEFRKYRGRRGVVEGLVHELQLKAGDYLLTVGIVPNDPGPHQFYEIHFLEYRITVQSNGKRFEGLFYPKVCVSHSPLNIDAKPITSEMIEAGRTAIARHLPSGVVLDRDAITELYIAMKQARDRANGPVRVSSDMAP